MGYTAESFIERAKLIHGDKYDYSHVVYKNMKTKVQIVCPEHGVFEQAPDKHIYGRCGCPRCAGNVQGSTSEFVAAAQRAHGNRYDYSRVQYRSSKEHVEIICRKHGSFFQSPQNHLSGNGCPKCANTMRLTTDEFIAKARQIHDDTYDYSCVQYEGNRKPVTIVCPKHGPFQQRPYSHLSGSGCPVCGRFLISQHRDAGKAYETAKQTFLKRYGVENPMMLEDIRAKQLERVQSEEVKQKRIATKRENGSFNTSLPEYRLDQLLIKQFGADDVVREYKSEKYPYWCDFYIKSRDLYIELNAHWSHGGHWYDERQDGATVDGWQGRSAFYDTAVDVFAHRDVAKRMTAQRNRLNYVVFWKANLTDAKKWFELGCPDGQDWLKEYSWL